MQQLTSRYSVNRKQLEILFHGRLLLACACLFMSLPLQAASYFLPQEGNYLVGKIRYVFPRAGDTLTDIARRHDLGINEILAANPGIDPRKLRNNRRIVLPTRFILPERPWRGVVVNLSEMRLYYFPEPGDNERRKVITHPLGIGRQGRPTPLGEYNVLMKIERPNWTMPKAVHEALLAKGIKKQRIVPPGPDNPLGEYAMMLNQDGLFMHGTNNPASIGKRVSSGCLRLYPEDISNLVQNVPKGTPVRIVDQPYKLGLDEGTLFLEVHVQSASDKLRNNDMSLALLDAEVLTSYAIRFSARQWRDLQQLAKDRRGIPLPVVNQSEKYNPGFLLSSNNQEISF